MPPSAFELEVNSITRWLGDTFEGADIHRNVVPAKFKRPAFLVETPRISRNPVLPAANDRATSVPVTYFGDPADITGSWGAVAFAGRMETALADGEGKIPLRDAAGVQAGVLRLEFEATQRSGTDTDLSITFRYRRLVWNRQRDLEGELIETINIRRE